MVFRREHESHKIKLELDKEEIDVLIDKLTSLTQALTAAGIAADKAATKLGDHTKELNRAAERAERAGRGRGKLW